MTRARDTSALSPDVRLTRRLLLRELRRYQRAGRFPKNRVDRDRMTPVFIDEDGTRCAMAHLMEVGGAGELVQRIARERNLAYIRELADIPELVAWLDAAGLTVDEAARIQPSYCPEAQAACVCNVQWAVGEGPADAVLEVSVLERVPPTTALDYPIYFRARIDAVYGSVPQVKPGDSITIPLETATPAGKQLVRVFAHRDSHEYVQLPLANAVSVDTCLGPACATVDAGADAGTTPGAPFLGIGHGLDHGAYANDRYPCDGAFAKQHPLTAPEVARAMMASDCAAEMARIDPAWASVPACEPNDEDAVLGCAASPNPVGASTTAGVLVAILGVVAARRLRRARRSTS